jgi:hypothetical protein
MPPCTLVVCLLDKCLHVIGVVGQGAFDAIQADCEGTNVFAWDPSAFPGRLYHALLRNQRSITNHGGFLSKFDRDQCYDDLCADKTGIAWDNVVYLSIKHQSIQTIQTDAEWRDYIASVETGPRAPTPPPPSRPLRPPSDISCVIC